MKRVFSSSSSKSAQGNALLLVRIVLALSGLIVIGFVIRHHLNIYWLRDYINDLGILAPLAFIPFSAFLVMIFIPPIFSIMLGWLAFGVVLGSSYSVVGMTVGSCLAFLVGRYYLDEVGVTLRQGKMRRTLERVNAAMMLHGFLTILGLKLLFFSNSALDYAVSRTELIFKEYLCGTVIGLIPRTLMLSYLFEAILRPGLVRAEVGFLGAPIENFLYESLLENILIEHAFTWAAILVSTRVCGVILLAILAKMGSGLSIPES